MTKSRRFILCPVGSAGDVFPFIAVARALADRGREVLLLATDNFRGAAEGVGVPFIAAGSVEDFERVKAIPDLWHPRRGYGVVMKLVTEGMREAYALLDGLIDPARDVLVLHALAFSGRVHQEVKGTPGSTLHLAPSALRSEFAQPALAPGLSLDRLPRPLKRFFWRLIDRTFLDPPLLDPLNNWRREFGLSPRRHFFGDWIHASGGMIALWPEFFGPPQPDWPQPIDYAGFPVFDGGQTEIDPDLRAWIEAGEAPIVFTPGSANLHSRAFVSAAAAAAKLLGRRTLILSSDPSGLEGSDPQLLRHATWAPLQAVAESAAALVHHGGIGTTSRALLAGIPQLIMPMGFDQPDNATRIARLGLGAWLQPRRFKGPALAAKLDALLSSATIAETCRRTAGELDRCGAGRAAEILINRHDS